MTNINEFEQLFKNVQRVNKQREKIRIKAHKKLLIRLKLVNAKHKLRYVKVKLWDREGSLNRLSEILEYERKRDNLNDKQYFKSLSRLGNIKLNEEMPLTINQPAKHLTSRGYIPLKLPKKRGLIK